MKWSLVFRWFLAFLILPGTVLVGIPYLLHLGVGFDFSAAPDVVRCVSLVVMLCGLVLSMSCMRLFAKLGEGTAAPWDPVRELVIAGPYRYLRNPMLVGVIVMLLGEALYLYSPVMLAYALIFVVVNDLYFRYSEEPALLKRYGKPYREYLENVPRWVPRLSPYQPSKQVGK